MKRILLLFVILLTMGAEAAIAQGRRISGRVLDETGQGLPGAGITVKGTSTGTVTDVDGNFALDLPEGNNVLVVQSIGYGTQTVTASGATVTIRLSPSSKELEGTVVTALALRREKRELGYATTTLTSDDLNNSHNSSALSAIQGKTAGVNITSTTGGPGGSTRVVLRGEKSIQNSNNALIVIDGVPVNNSSRSYNGLLVTGRDERYQVDFGNRGNDVNPEDIESVTVLQGPAAAALYGAIAANGAIMITTKSGKGHKNASKNSFSYETRYELSSILKLPAFQNEYGQGNIYQGIADDRRENFSWGAKFNDSLRGWGQIINGQQKFKPYSAIKNNVRDFFNVGKTWENTLSLGGSNEQGNSYFLSLNTLNNTGVIPNTFYDKYSVRFNGEVNLPNKMYSTINVNYLNIYSRVEQQGQGNESIYNNIIQTPRDIPITELKDLNDIFNSMGYLDSNGIARYGYYGAYTNNPYWLADKVDNRNRTDRVLGSFVVGYKPNDHWNIFNRLGVDAVSDRSQLKIPKYNYLPFEEDYYSDPGGLQTRTGQGGYMEDNRNTVQIYNDLIANYTQELSKDFTFTGLLGANLQSARATILIGNISDQNNGLVLPDYYNLQNANGPVNNVNNLTETRQVGLYGQAAIDFQKTLILTVTGRNDWTSTLRPGNWSFFYPSASLSWVFTENLKKSGATKVLNFGKIRASASSVGNGGLAYQSNAFGGFTRTESTTGFGSITFPFMSTPGYTTSDILYDPDLKPEKTRSWEIGTDLAFFDNKISLSATYYTNKSIDVIQTVPTPPSSGYLFEVQNIGDISNKGIELEARVTPISTASGFKWDLYGTYTKNKSNVDKLSENASQTVLGGISGMTVTATVDKPFGAFYGTDLLTDGQGHVVVDPSSGLPRTTPNPVYKGTYQPDFIASWGTTLKYQGLELNVLFTTKQGGKYFSYAKSTMDFNGTAEETGGDRGPRIWENSVIDNGDGTFSPNTTPYSPYDYFVNVIPSGQHIVDASFVKLNEASLYYTFPQKMLNRTFLGSASIGVYGNNLFVWAKSKYGDPEMGSGGNTNLQGFDYGSRPSLRNYGISLKVTF